MLRNVIGSSVSEYPALFASERNKMASRFVSVTENELFSINESGWQNNSKKATKFGNKSFKDMFCLQMMNGGDKPTFRKIVLKI